MHDFLIRPVDIFEIVKRQRKVIMMAFAAAFLLVMIFFAVVPRTYQTEMTIHIGVNYFQNPLIGELISQTHDPGELRAERERIVKTSLGVEWATKIGEKYKLFKTEPNDVDRPLEVEWFLKSVDISPMTATQFKIKIKAGSPAMADGIIHGAIDAIREYMYVNRIQMLESFMGVLQSEISGTSENPLSDIGSPNNTPSKIEAAKAQVAAQIKMLERRLEDLLRAYNDQHPSVQSVRAQIAELRTIERGGSFSPTLTRRKIFNMGNASGNLKDDLSKQRHLVNISLEMERKDPTMSAYLSLVEEPVIPKKPSFPKLRLFLLFALISGVMSATLAAAVFEFWQRTPVPPKDFAKLVGIEFFGNLEVQKPRG